MAHDRRIWLTIFAAAVGFSAGCSNAAEPLQENVPTQEVVATMGDTFTVGVGQQVRVQGEPLRLAFESVTEDSRCPLDVQCVWEGNGQVRLSARSGADESVLELNTTVPPKSARYGPYEISLERLDPYPATSDRIPQNQYVAKLRVVRF